MRVQKPWHGLVTIRFIKHWRKGKIIWESGNIKNLLHSQGEEFIVNALFTGGSVSTVIPSIYYIGLDDRGTVAVTDTTANISNEPIGNGYARVPVASSGDFIAEIATNGHWTAVSPLLIFSATAGGAGWGPVQNLFLTDAPDLSGNLISTTAIGTVISVTAGDDITLQLDMSLLDCTPSPTTTTTT
jgi:hypothetical protein